MGIPSYFPDDFQRAYNLLPIFIWELFGMIYSDSSRKSFTEKGNFSTIGPAWRHCCKAWPKTLRLMSRFGPAYCALERLISPPIKRLTKSSRTRVPIYLFFHSNPEAGRCSATWHQRIETGLSIQRTHGSRESRTSYWHPAYRLWSSEHFTFRCFWTHLTVTRCCFEWRITFWRRSEIS